MDVMEEVLLINWVNEKAHYSSCLFLSVRSVCALLCACMCAFVRSLVCFFVRLFVCLSVCLYAQLRFRSNARSCV